MPLPTRPKWGWPGRKHRPLPPITPEERDRLIATWLRTHKPTRCPSTPFQVAITPAKETKP